MSVTLHTTHGPIKLELHCSSTPKAAENFLALCASSFYTGSPVHRIHPGFIIQTGAPASDPKARTSTSIWAESDDQDGTASSPFFPDELRPALRHNARGVLSMANKGPDTNGSQFFVTLAPQPQLDGKNTVFGRVIDGWETLDKLEALETDKKGRPKEKAAIETVTVHANPLAE